VSTDPHVAPVFPSSALITIDVQRDFLSESPHGIPGTTEILPRLTRLVEAFRAAGLPVVHVVRLYRSGGADADRVRRSLLASGVQLVVPGSPGSQLADEVLPAGCPALDPDLLLSGGVQHLGSLEFVVYKPRWGAFHRTPLEPLLHEQGVDTVVVAGCNLPNCPRATLFEASERDFRVVAVVDALSRARPEALEELSGIGVTLMDVSAVVEALRG